MYTFEEHVQDLQNHIALVQKNATFLALTIAEEGQVNIARVLLANAAVHDASKWQGIEWECLHMGPTVSKTMVQKAVIQHQKTNRHHPEYWGGLSQMPIADGHSVYVAEMVCDWMARSQEFAEDLREFIDEKAAMRFNFASAPQQSVLIHKYVDMLLPKKFVE